MRRFPALLPHVINVPLVQYIFCVMYGVYHVMLSIFCTIPLLWSFYIFHLITLCVHHSLPGPFRLLIQFNLDYKAHRPFSITRICQSPFRTPVCHNVRFTQFACIPFSTNSLEMCLLRFPNSFPLLFKSAPTVIQYSSVSWVKMA